MNVINKLEEILHQFALEGRPSKQVDVFLTSRDYDDFQEEMSDRTKFFASSSSSGDKNLTTGTLTFRINGFTMAIHRAIYRADYMVYEIGTDREMYVRSIVVYDKKNQGKEIILL